MCSAVGYIDITNYQ